MYPRRKSARTFAISLAVLFGATYASHLALAQKSAGGQNKRPPLVIERQGSFLFNYRMVTLPGTFEGTQTITNHSGEIFSVNQGYVFFQIPQNAREYPVVMVHGGGQTGKTYEDLRDRDGFQSIFLRRGWSVYIPDLGGGKAGGVGGDKPSGYGLKAAFNLFRLGYWTDQPRYYPGVQFKKEDLDQLAAGGSAQPGRIAGATGGGGEMGDKLTALVGEVGPAVLFTHSGSGLPGWQTAMKSPNVKGIITFEPGTFVFPAGEAPPSPRSAAEVSQNQLGDTIPGGIHPPTEVPPAEFEKLTHVPILIVFGDNIPKTLDAPAANPWQEFWRQFPERARQFVATIKRHGGDAEILFLPDVGVRGNTHWAFAEPNNVQMADQYSKWLQRKGLDHRKP